MLKRNASTIKRQKYKKLELIFKTINIHCLTHFNCLGHMVLINYNAQNCCAISVPLHKIDYIKS